MKLSVFVSSGGAALLLGVGAWLPMSCLFAEDKLFLKSGEVLEGAVIEDTPAGVKIQVRTGTIKETKSFSRDKVDRIERPKPDDVAFSDLKAKLPTPSLLDEAGYRKLIELAERFGRDYADSQHKQAVQGILDELKGEFAKVTAGGLKVNGEWISPEDRNAHKENIDADIMLTKISALARSGAYLQALRGLDALRTQYGKTKASAASYELGMGIMRAYGRQLTQVLEDRKAYEAALAERKARMTEAEVRAVEADAAQKKAQIDSLNLREKAAGVKWFSVNTDSLESISAAIEDVRKQLAVAEKAKVADMKADAEALYEAETLLTKGELDAAELKLREALRSKSKTLSTKEPHPARVIADLVAAKEKKANEAKLAAMEKAKQEAEQGKPVLNQHEGRTVSAEDALDAVMSERPAKGQGKTAEEKSAKGKSSSSSKAKPTAKSKPAVAEDAEVEGTAAKKPRPPAAAEEDEGGGISFTLIMAAVFVVLAGATGGIYFLNQKKKAAEGGGEE